MRTKSILASLIIGLVLIGPAPAFGAYDENGVWDGNWDDYTRFVDQYEGDAAAGVHDGIFNWDYAGEWGVGGVPHYMELADDAKQIGVDGSGNPLYEYLIVQYNQHTSGYNIVQYFYGFDVDQITNLYDHYDPYAEGGGAMAADVPMEFWAINRGVDPAEELFPVGAIPNWFATWTPNAAVDWGFDIPDGVLDSTDRGQGNYTPHPKPSIKVGDSWSGGTATEDIIWMAADGMFGFDFTGWTFVLRIETTQRLVYGDLTWAEGDHLYITGPVLGNFFPELTPGDFNGQDGVNDIDIDLLCDFIRNGLDYDSLYDISGDGVTGGTDGFVDINDLDYLIRFLVETTLGTGTEYADFNLDGLVDTTDLTRLATDYGAGDTWAKGNANRNIDLLTDTTDLTILATYYGFEATPDAIPEPMTLSLLALGGLGMLRRRRK